MKTFLLKKDIKFITNVKITAVGKDKLVYDDLEDSSYELPAKFTMLMPRLQGPDVVASAGDKVANLINKMVMVNRCFQNPTYKNLYAVGVVTAIPPVEKTPISTGTPKTGQIIEGMAMAVAMNII